MSSAVDPLAPRRPGHPPGPRPKGGPPISVPARRLLLQIARFGYLTPSQAAALGHVSRMVVSAGSRDLERRGWLTRITLIAGFGTGKFRIYALTPAGRRALARFPDRPVSRRHVRLDYLDSLLAAADLAAELEGSGAGTWVTWAEYVRDHPAPAQLPMVPAGLLRSSTETLRPYWIVLRAVHPGRVRESVQALYRDPQLEPPEVRAWPSAYAGLDALALPGTIRPWTPQHLQGRSPMQPGWAAATAAPEDVRPLGARTLRTLAFLDRFGYATHAQLARAAGRRRAGLGSDLKRWEQRGLVQRQPRAPGRIRPDAWSATAAGLAAVGTTPDRVLPPTPLHRRHSLALVDLAHHLEATTGGRWETEREIAGEARERFGGDITAPPDGRLVLPDGHRILVQLQLSPGHAADQCRNAWLQRLRGLGDEILFICTPEVAPAYRRAITPAEADFIRVDEWTPPDHSGGVAEPNPRFEAWRRAYRQRATKDRSGPHGEQREA